MSRLAKGRHCARFGPAWVVVVAALAGAAGCPIEATPVVERDAGTPEKTVVPPRTPELRTYPCVEQCHAERKPNPTKRKLQEFHTLRRIEHGESMFWCPFCHNPDNLDRLQLLDGTAVPFDSSYRLCGQCHGAKINDWEHGIHGLQTGQFWGRRERRNCPVCHDPHDPHRPKFEALPPPEAAPEEADHE